MLKWNKRDNNGTLIHIKNEISLIEESKTQNKKENERENDNTKRIKYAKEGTGNKNDIIKIKGETLVFFENVIINLEIIKEDMKDLRIKGSSFPKQIKIKVKRMKEIKYDLSEEIKDFKDIGTFLSKVKNSYNSSDSMYKEKLDLDFYKKNNLEVFWDI